VAAEDGSTAPAAVWITRDRAAHWQRGADLVTGDALQWCSIQPDEVDPAIAVVGTVPSGYFVNPPGTLRTYATVDGGATWTPFTGPYDTVDGLATYRGVTFARFALDGMSTRLPVATLARSSVHLRTWAPLTPPPGGPVAAFWLNPATGELLALTFAGYGNRAGSR
jgi:hypothetical protein